MLLFRLERFDVGALFVNVPLLVEYILLGQLEACCLQKIEVGIVGPSSVCAPSFLEFSSARDDRCVFPGMGLLTP